MESLLMLSKNINPNLCTKTFSINIVVNFAFKKPLNITGIPYFLRGCRIILSILEYKNSCDFYSFYSLLSSTLLCLPYPSL